MTAWSQQAHIFASNGAPADLFGCSVSVYSNTVVVGAIGDDTSKGSNSGMEYLCVIYMCAN